MERQIVQKEVAIVACPYLVLIPLVDRVADGVEVIRRVIDTNGEHIDGQFRVERLAHPLKGNLRHVCIEPRDLPFGVNAGVGPAGTDDRDRMPDHLLQRVPDLPLDGAKPFDLFLPAVEVRAAVGECESETHDRAGYARQPQNFTPPPD